MADARHIALEETIARVATGDRAAFDALYEATSARLHAVCLSVLKDRPDAEDTLQEVYIRVWKGASRYAVNGLSPMTWLITIARNSAIDRLRARAARPASPGTASTGLETAAELPSGQPSAEAQTIMAQERARLGACLGTLGQQQADAVRAVYLEGMSYADLAAREGMPINTLRSWLRRSLLRLKDCVSQ